MTITKHDYFCLDYHRSCQFINLIINKQKLEQITQLIKMKNKK